MRIGAGRSDDVIVVDVLSLVAGTSGPRWIVWPAEGSEGVPRRFQPELPHPVPDRAGGATLGYPITLQSFGAGADEEVELTLLRGGVDGEVVDGHLSTPERPSNPELAPAGAVCLIPSEPLAAQTRYTVVARDTSSSRELTWSFRTGK